MAYTSKINLRMPPELREEAAAVAQALGLSLNTFILQAVRNWTGYQAREFVKYRETMRGPAPAPAPTPVAPAGQSQAVGVAKVGANQPCPCGSGQKYKRCHGRP